MRKSIGRFFLIITLVMSVVAVQNVFADDFTIVGEITAISTSKPCTVTLDDDIVINGMKINYLSNQYNIDLETGMLVSIDYYEFTCSDGTTKNMATSITVDDVTVQLR